MLNSQNFKGGAFILRKLKNNGFDAHIVGGAPRNYKLGVEINDIDICTNATPKKIKKIFEGFSIIEVGESFGTINVIVEGIQYEITTYRSEEYDGVSRKPKCIMIESLEEDLIRRDFTINTLTMDEEGNVIDRLGGLKDYSLGILRAANPNPTQMIQDDPLRILRAIRFAYKFDLYFEAHLMKALMKNAYSLDRISKERIRDEFTKILVNTDKISQALRTMKTFGVLKYTIPELEGIVNFDQNSKYHILKLDKHTETVLNRVKNDHISKWTALLHDIGKPMTERLKEDRTSSYIGHEKVSSEMAENILTRLKFSNKDKKLIIALISKHMLGKITDIKDYTRYKIVQEVGKENMHHLMDLWNADSRDGDGGKLQCEKMEEFMNSPYVDIKLVVNGNDIAELGVPRGQRIGELLEGLKKRVINKQLTNNRRALQDRVVNLISQRREYYGLD